MTVAPGEQTDYITTAIVSTYNSEFYIANCLESLLSQTIAEHIEILVIDSGSQQSEEIIVSDFQKRHKNIRYLRTDRETIYGAWNRAAKIARGKYLTNANTDDVYRQDALERLVFALETNPEASLAYANCLVTDQPNRQFINAHTNRAFIWPDFSPLSLFQCCHIGPQPLWRKDLHLRYGYFDDSMVSAGDYDFWLRLAVKERFVHVDEFLGTYLLAPSSIEHANQERSFKESIVGRERNWPHEWGEIPPMAGYYLRSMDVQPSAQVKVRKIAPNASIILLEKSASAILEGLRSRPVQDIEAIVIGSDRIPEHILTEYGSDVPIKAVHIPGADEKIAISISKMLAEGRFVY